jgi:uncharacterized protein
MTETAKCPVCGWEIADGGVQAEGSVTVCSDECARAETRMEVIRRVYEAFDRRDVEGIMEHFSPGVVWFAAESSPLADQSPYHGADAVRTGVFQRIFAAFDFTIQVDEMFAAGDRVLMLGYYDGVLKANQKPFRAQVSHVWTVVDGRVTRFQQYLDTLKVAKLMQ